MYDIQAERNGAKYQPLICHRSIFMRNVIGVEVSNEKLESIKSMIVLAAHSAPPPTFIKFSFLILNSMEQEPRKFSAIKNQPWLV